MHTMMISALFLVGASAFVPMQAPRAPAVQVASRRAVSPACIAKTPEEKALALASRKVTAVAKRFGSAQGKAAQAWVEKAVAEKSVAGESLMEMQLALFDECSVDDESGRCKELSEAIDAMKDALEDTSEPDAFAVLTAKTPIQEAATKVREAASKFGTEQKDAADAWIKMVVLGTDAKTVTPGFRESLLAQKITLFGECLLSEDGTPSDCEQLEGAITALSEAIELTKPVESWYDSGLRLEGAVVEGSVVPTKEARFLGSRRLKRWLTKA